MSMTLGPNPHFHSHSTSNCGLQYGSNTVSLRLCFERGEQSATSTQNAYIYCSSSMVMFFSALIQKKFKNAIQQIVDSLKEVRIVLPKRLKSVGRIVEKCVLRHGSVQAGVRCIRDVVRAMVICPTTEEVCNVQHHIDLQSVTFNVYAFV